MQWDKALEVETKVQQILTQQEINGVTFDAELAYNLVESITSEEDEIYSTLRPYLKTNIVPLGKPVSKPFTIKGEYSAQALKAFPDTNETRIVGGPFSKFEYIEPEFSKRDNLAQQLINLGWQPEEFTETGKPMLTIKGQPVESLNQIEGEFGKLLGRWVLIEHRKNQIKGLISKVRDDGKLTAEITGSVTNTFRRKHKVVCNIPKAKPNVVLGKEMRSLFTSSKGKILVGHDAAALEARVMGHYTFPFDDGQFAEEMMKGIVHDKNAAIFNITRDNAKILFYAMIYGASPTKFCKVFSWSMNKSKKVVNSFWKENIALGKLRDKVIVVGKKNGYLPGIDGRAIRLRGSEHAWLNALFQSCGAIAMNYSMVLLHQNCREKQIDFNQLIYYHDEILSEVDAPSIVHQQMITENLKKGLILDKSNNYYSAYGEQAVLSIREAGKLLKLRCSLDSDYQIGRTWAEVH